MQPPSPLLPFQLGPSWEHSERQGQGSRQVTAVGAGPAMCRLGRRQLRPHVLYGQETLPPSSCHACQSEMEQGEAWTKAAGGARSVLDANASALHEAALGLSFLICSKGLHPPCFAWPSGSPRRCWSENVHSVNPPNSPDRGSCHFRLRVKNQ